MWFHYECVGLSKEMARKIPDSNPFVCINCNDQKLYENPSTEINSPIQIQSASKMNQTQTCDNEINIERKENEDVIILHEDNSKTLSSKPKVIDDLNKGKDNAKNLETDSKQGNPNPVKGSKKSSVNHLKRKSNADGNEIENKTLIIQLERQIKEKDKTINLLRRLNDCGVNENAGPNINTQDQTNQSTACQNCQTPAAHTGLPSSVTQSMDHNGIENRMKFLEMNAMQNLAIMTNNNTQMQTQMQMLTNQMAVQSQNLMVLQQQQLLTNNLYRYPQVPVINGFNQGFNVVQPQQFYNRPIYHPGLFYQVPYTQGHRNVQGYIPVWHPAQPASYHTATLHPRTSQPRPEQPVNAPRASGTTENINNVEDHPNSQTGSMTQQGQTTDKTKNCEETKENEQMQMMENHHVANNGDEDATLLNRLNAHNKDKDSHSIPKQNYNSDSDKRVAGTPPNPKTAENTAETIKTMEVNGEGSATKDNFLRVPGRKHFPPDHQDLMMGRISERL